MTPDTLPLNHISIDYLTNIGCVVDASSGEWSFFGGRDGGMLVVVVFMSVTSVLICPRILPRFCSGEFFTYFLSL